MSLRKAIDCYCRSCLFDPNSKGTWRQQVSECTSKKCPLYAVRPKATSTIASSEIIDSSAKISPKRADSCHSNREEAA